MTDELTEARVRAALEWATREAVDFRGAADHAIGWADCERKDARDDADKCETLAALARAWLANAAAPPASPCRPIETAPRDGRRLLMTDGISVHVCYPKTFPRPFSEMPKDPNDWPTTSQPGDVWEYFRTEHAPGHSWSIRPTHWQPIDKLPSYEEAGR